ncbi:zinc finger, C4 type, partial [Teladorsagia circumcincta]
MLPERWFDELRMKSRKQCVICESPTARSIHFGARSCKACAAFFRRTIALGVTFECKESVPCTIHYVVRSTRGAKAVSTTSDDDHMVMEHTEFSLPSQSVDDTRPLESKRSLRSSDVSRIPVVADLMREDRRWAVEHYQKIEAALNSRRKIMYTDTKMMDVFTTLCKC